MTPTKSVIRHQKCTRVKITNVNLPLFIFIITFFLNFGVPYLYYLYVKKIRGGDFGPHRAIAAYLSGMIGDAVCAPFINTFIFLTYYNLPTPVKPNILTISLLIGVGLTALLHITQAKIKMTNWSMPQPWRWTFPGKYHMFSATVQFSFLIFSAHVIWQNWATIFNQPPRLFYILMTLLFALVFNLTFTKDTLLPALNEAPSGNARVLPRALLRRGWALLRTRLTRLIPQSS